MSFSAPTRTAVVTGGGSGLGLEIVETLVNGGWTVHVLARNADNLAVARERLGERFRSHVVDVADYNQVADLFRELALDGEEIDLLVNNAARFKMAPFIECTAADITAIVDTNLKGTMYCSHQVIPLLKRPGGRIVNVASVAATHGIADQAIYCASKYGVDGFAEALGQELIADGIAVTTVYPGGIDTPLWNASNPYPGDISRTLRAGDVAGVVRYVADMPPRVICKKIVLFPRNEWH